MIDQWYADTHTNNFSDNDCFHGLLTKGPHFVWGLFAVRFSAVLFFCCRSFSGKGTSMKYTSFFPRLCAAAVLQPMRLRHTILCMYIYIFSIKEKIHDNFLTFQLPIGNMPKVFLYDKVCCQFQGNYLQNIVHLVALSGLRMVFLLNLGRMLHSGEI